MTGRNGNERYWRLDMVKFPQITGGYSTLSR